MAKQGAVKCNDKNVLARRPVHALNDASVRVREGAATPQSMFRNGATMAPEHLPIGIVWAVAGGNAIVDFGSTESGYGLRLVVPESDLVAC